MAPHLENQKLLQAEQKITYSMIIYISGFVITWTPYTFISLYTSFIKQNESFPTVSLISALIAKTSLVWSTLLYMFTNTNIRSKLKLNKLISASSE